MFSLEARTGASALLDSAPADAVALVAGTQTISYGDLRTRVAERLGQLELPRRSLVVLEATNSPQFVTTYLATLNGGHVPLLAGSHVDRLAGVWNADAVVRADGPDISIEHRATTGHDLHADLALLLSTSGSTGSPKLVRLSHANVVSNARSIAQALGIRSTDRGITSLPLHYCYGLSVLHSHLAAGASMVISDASVVDPCFRAAMSDHRVTNLAGVPHTFELLDRAGPDSIHTESLRFITQAGGRLAPERVVEWVERGERWGVDFYVMYGQTEATARIAVLPPDLACRRPGAIGAAIPGGEIEIRPVDGLPDGVGDIVYRGPNVMLGYAETPADLGLGRTTNELVTGDLGRFHSEDGVYEVVGRRSRFVKPFGLRVDLDAIEAELASVDIVAAVAGDDRRVVVCAPDADSDAVRERVGAFTGLPAGAITVDRAAIPRTSGGKVDYAEVVGRTTSEPIAAAVAGGGTSVADVFGKVLGRSDVAPTSTFVSLGGDSLNYVECSIQLEQLLGRLPAAWHLIPVGELESMTRHRQPRFTHIARIETTVLLRALGICAIVSTHMFYVWYPGGSHLLLALAGYNLARFQLAMDGARVRIVAGLRTATRVAVPAVIWTAVCMVLVGGYGWATLALVNNNVGPIGHADGRWHFWFTEAFVQLTLAVTVVLAVPMVRRWERRLPYLFPVMLFAVLVMFRYHWIEFGGATNLRFRTHGVAWFFVLGWIAQQSTTRPKQIVTTLLCVATIPGFFGNTDREWFIALGLVAVVWVRAVPLPRPLIRVIAAIAAASMWIYITHFRVFPPLDRQFPRGLAFMLTLAAGVAAWRATEYAGRLVSRARVSWHRSVRPVPQREFAVVLD